jgi:FkbM family methyltransferase
MYDFDDELEDLDRLLQPHLHPDFFFVNIGANDGVVADPTYPFIQKYGWRGIAVEPVPYVFEQLKRNYAHLDGIILENAAVSNRQESFWYVEQGSGTVDYIAQGMGSLDRDRLLETIKANRLLAPASSPTPPVPKDLRPPECLSDHDGPIISDRMEDFVTELRPRCLSFGELMAKHGVEHVDFVNIDVEGRDHEVFFSIDFERFRPSVVCVELMGLPDGQPEEIRARLGQLGYRFARPFTLFSEIFVLDPTPAAAPSGPS